MSDTSAGTRPTLEMSEVGSSSASKPPPLAYRPQSVLVPPAAPGPRFSRMSTYSDSKYPLASSHASWGPQAAGAYMLAHGPYNPALDNHGRDDDDRIHDPDPPGYRERLSGTNPRGAMNVAVLLLVILGCFALFLGYPVTDYVLRDTVRSLIGSNQLVNGSGQAAVLANMPKLIDPDTPQDALTHTSLVDGSTYDLVFSDEFNQDYRTFYPGEDPWWEAVDIWYGATKDLEWYDPQQVTTRDGFLRILIEQVDPAINHELEFRSGMLQSWNKFCFTNGYIEARVQLPGKPTTAGYWPGFWIMGNLGRPGYQATSEGTWPYSYDSCDIGTLPNQTTLDKTGPPSSFNVPVPYGRDTFNYELSYLPGQKLSACTCPGEDHPGPMVDGRMRGRAAPEIDVLEAQNCKRRENPRGCVSQSAQFAPFTAEYNHPFDPPAFTINSPDKTEPNAFRGSALQQSVSCISNVSDATFADADDFGSEHGGYGVFGFEYQAHDDPAQAYVAWVADGQRSHTITGETVGPDPITGVGQRLIPYEPMSVVLNLAVSEGFQTVDRTQMTFPAEFLIDYVRIYQKRGSPESAISCDPPDYPTTQYISDHLNAYMEANLSSWAAAGYSYPRNSQIVGQC